MSAAPNGALLVFDNRQATAGVHVLDPGSDTPRPIHLGPPTGGAQFSPDGTKIALVQETSGGTGDVVVYNADGSGGPQALSPAVEAQIKALHLVPRRLAGPDRFSTATVIAAEVSPHPHTVLVATGRNYPDALAAGAAAATDPDGGVVLLSDDSQMPGATRSYLAGVPDPTRIRKTGRRPTGGGHFWATSAQ